ncbi:DUF397 domain-containing protein [Actinokineospora inagensis]|uniref:DUF397 domain-containing protein n=1 Tax=Actinokineospora inagensis TaxID=103730 RepID=UPI00040DAB19|nr:DUF397 domain-containing protein [Actinokineospora inagensis]
MTWHRSTFSGAAGGNNNCVEIARPTPTAVHLRDSKHTTATLRFPTPSFTTFLTTVR